MRWTRNKEWVLFFLLLLLSFVIGGAHEYGNRLLFATLMEKEGLAEREREIENKEGEKCLQWS